MSMPSERLYTAQEYLAMERVASEKHEYVNGRIYAMPGGTFEHARVSTNLIERLGPVLPGTNCQILVGDLRVKVEATGMYTYPDALILCTNPDLEDAEKDTLLNPTVVFEVLSKSTEKYDRGEKFAHYRRIDSLRQYVLLSQNKIAVESFIRQPGDRWLLETFDSGASSLPIHVGTGLPATVKVLLPLADVYAGVPLMQLADGTTGPDDRSPSTRS